MCFGFYSKALITCHLNTVPCDLYRMLVVSMHIYYMTFAKNAHDDYNCVNLLSVCSDILKKAINDVVGRRVTLWFFFSKTHPELDRAFI